MTSRIDISVVYCSGQDDVYPARNLEDSSSSSLGWQSARFCQYPQELGFRLNDGVCRIRQLQFLSHEYKISKRIEIYAGGSLNDDYSTVKFTRLGYISLESNDSNNFSARQLKTVKLDNNDVKGLYIKLLLHHQHINELNLYGQIALVAFNVIGEVVEPFVSEKPREAIIGLPDPMDDLQFRIEFDAETARKLKELGIRKQIAIEREDFEDAKRAKKAMEALESMGVQLARLDMAKKDAILNEDFDSAAEIKKQIDVMRRDVDDICMGKPKSKPVSSSPPPPAPPQERKVNILTLDNDEPIRVKNDDERPIRGVDERRLVAENERPDVDDEEYEKQPKQSLDDRPIASEMPRNRSDEQLNVNPDERPIKPMDPLKSALEYGGTLRASDLDQPSKPPKPSKPPVDPDNLETWEEVKVVSQKRPVSPYVSANGSARPASAPKNNTSIVIVPPTAPAPIIVDEKPAVAQSSQNEYAINGDAAKAFELEQQRLAKTDIQEPEPLKGDSINKAAPIVSAFGEYIARCCMSKVWSLREHGVQEVTKIINTGPVPADLFDGLNVVIKRGLEDKLTQVTTATTDLVKACMDKSNACYVGGNMTSFLSFISPLYVELLNHSNSRLRIIAEETIFSISNITGGCQIMMPVLISKPCKTPKAFVDKLKVIKQILKDTMTNSKTIKMLGTNTGTTIDEYCTFITANLEHANGDVRSGIIDVAVMLYVFHRDGAIAITRVFDLAREDLVEKFYQKLSEAGVKTESMPVKSTAPEQPVVITKTSASASAKTTSPLPTRKTNQRSPSSEQTRKKTPSPSPKRTDQNVKTTETISISNAKHATDQDADLPKTGIPLPKRSSSPNKRQPIASQPQSNKVQQQQQPKPVVAPVVSDSPETSPIRNSGDISTGTTRWSMDKRCVFCGKTDPAFTEDLLDKHFWKDCPMLSICSECGQVVEIAHLKEHLLEECEGKTKFVECQRCGLPCAEDAAESHKSTCTPVSDFRMFQRCILCNEEIASGDSGWKRHLTGSPACRGSSRTTKIAPPPSIATVTKTTVPVAKQPAPGPSPSPSEPPVSRIPTKPVDKNVPPSRIAQPKKR